MLSTKTIMKNNSQDNIFQNIHTSNVEQNHTSDVPGLDFSGFGRARAFMYRASGGPGFSLSGFELFSGFSKV